MSDGPRCRQQLEAVQARQQGSATIAGPCWRVVLLEDTVTDVPNHVGKEASRAESRVENQYTGRCLFPGEPGWDTETTLEQIIHCADDERDDGLWSVVNAAGFS